jgi:predicted dehydrogenase
MILTSPENGRPLRGAIIGFGNVAENAHLPVWQRNPHFCIKAVVEPDPGRARKAQELLPAARVFQSVEGIFCGNGFDFVDICTPPRFHEDLVLASCRSGLHVFCEKPLTTSLRNLARIQEAASGSKRVVFTVNNWKHAPLWVKTCELIQENRIGPVRSISMNVLRESSSGGGSSNWRSDPGLACGGITIDHGWHNLYLILSMVREAPLSIQARMEPFPGGSSGLEETVELIIRFPLAEARLYLTWRAPCRRNFGTVEGECGTLSIDDDHILLVSKGSPPVRFEFPQALSAGSHHPEWMDRVVEEFSQEIADTRRRGANLMEAHRCIQLIELAYLSSREASCPMELRGLDRMNSG